jgi:hypothetical protein
MILANHIRVTDGYRKIGGYHILKNIIDLARCGL